MCVFSFPLKPSPLIFANIQYLCIYIADFIHQDQDLQKVVVSISDTLMEIKRNLKSYVDMSTPMKFLNSFWLDHKISIWNTQFVNRFELICLLYYSLIDVDGQTEPCQP